MCSIQHCTPFLHFLSYSTALKRLPFHPWLYTFPRDQRRSAFESCYSVTFQGFLGVDYFGDDREVATVDTGPGLVVADELECIAACIAQAAEGCNAASYYGSLLETEW